MKSPINIVGAGMAGLLAARMLAIHNRRVVVFEAQDRLPNNHSAVLRFRSSVVGDVLGIPFKKVSMIKDVVPWRNPVADALSYSMKATGSLRSDRSISYGPVSAERWIAPPDLIKQMADGVNVVYNHNYSFINPLSKATISTIPMPALMKALDYKGKWPEFRHHQGINVISEIADCDAYVTLMFPDPEIPFTRASITGNQMIVECTLHNNSEETWFPGEVADLAANFLGVPCPDNAVAVPQRYAKILPIDEEQRRAFMFWSTIEKGIYKLGRYGTWRPKLMADDLVQDIRRIEGWIDNPDPYGLSLRK